MTDFADVLIIGAGPAGSTAALAAKTLDPSLKVVLVDKAVFPRDKSCGDGLGPGVVRVLESLGASHIVDGALKPDSVFVGGPGGYEGFAEGPTIKGRDLSGYVIPRLDFDARLVREAVSRGVELWESAEFRETGDVVDGERLVRLKNTSNGNDIWVSTRFLVGADGAYSRVRRSLGAHSQDKEFVHIATRAYAPFSDDREGKSDFSALRIDFEPNLLPAYGWLFPISKDVANVGVGIPFELLRKKDQSLEQLLYEYLSTLRSRGIAVGNPVDITAHQLPHAAERPPLVYPRAALIGDAASMINSLSGEGIAYGMAAGELLGRTLARSESLRTDVPLVGFEKAFNRRFGLHLKSCWIAHRLLRSPWWATRVIKAASRDQLVMDDAAQLLFDEQRMKVGTGLRIAAKGM